MLYFGTALGAAAGGAASTAFGFGTLAWVGVAFALLAGLSLVAGGGGTATPGQVLPLPAPVASAAHARSPGPGNDFDHV